MPPHFLDQTPKNNRIQQLLLRLVDLGLIMALFVVPMVLGGNHSIGRLVLIVSASIAGTAWAAHQAIRRERFFPSSTMVLVILGVGLVIPIVQLVPLPEALRNILSPHLAEILPLWQSTSDPATRLGNWQCLSLTPNATQAGLIIFAAYSLLFIVVAGRVKTTKDLQRVLQWCGGAVLLVAIFAFVQYFLGNGKFFWIYEHPFKNADANLQGPFVNRNHFAQFMALGIGPILIWVVAHATSATHRSRRKSKHATKATNMSSAEKNLHESQTNRIGSGRHFRFDKGTHTAKTHHSSNSTSMKAGQFLLAMTAGLVVFACLLSLSRGGSIAMLIAIVVCCGLSLSVKGASRKMLATVTMAGVILGGALMIFGYEKVCNRLGNLTSGDVELMDHKVGRRAIWETDLRASSHFPLFGTGVGSHREVYPIFFDYAHYDYYEFTHAENGYIQTLLETGGIGFLVLLSAIGLVGFWCIKGIKQSRSDQLRLCFAAISAAIAASLFHAMTDFFWYIPGCATMTVIMTACAFCAYRLACEEADESTATNVNALSELPSPRQSFSPMTAWATVGVVALFSIFMVQERLGPVKAQPYWDAYLRAEKKSEYDKLVLDDLPPETLREAGQFYAAQIERLRNVVRFDPHNARAHRSLALNCLKLFDVYQVCNTNPMSLTHIGDAVLHSEFASKEALIGWLHRAFGKHVSLLKLAQYHALRSVHECPTIDLSYVFLTELCFLDRYDFTQKKQLIDQALLVRPQSGQSVLGLARNALVAGDLEQWAELSRRVYDMNFDTRKLVLRDLLDNSQTDMLPAMVAIIIQYFEPDHEGASYMLSRCVKRMPEEQLADLRRYCATQALSGLEKCTAHEEAERRLLAATQYQKLGESETALKQLRIAYQCDPNHFGVRQTLAITLLKQGFPKEAQDHFQWCLRRKPGNKWLAKMARDALAAHLDAQALSGDNGKVTR